MSALRDRILTIVRVFQNEYGEPCEPVDAPEKIANAIGNFSPEQVHALLAETRRSLQEDPEEARRALVNNPQITYALLLALVRGRYISKERGTVMPSASIPQNVASPLLMLHSSAAGSPEKTRTFSRSTLSR